MHSPGPVAASDLEAREQFWPAWKAVHDRLTRERGWGGLTPEAFEAEVEEGSLPVRIARTVETLGLSRFELTYAAAGPDHEPLIRTIEFYGTDIIPAMRDRWV